MRFLDFSKCLKTTLELTEKLATGKAEPHSWYSYFVTNVGHYCTVIIEGIYNSLSWSHLKLTVQIQLINANSVEKHCCYVECKSTSKS